jgi:1,4-alpha-glucan branching enzyme
MTTRKTPSRRRVTFQVRARPGSTVCLAGSFNGWSPAAKRLRDAQGDGTYRATLLLAPGCYEYKFVVDGMWCVDPAASESVANDVGSLNSVITVA